MEGFDQASWIDNQQQKLTKNFLTLSAFRNGIHADGMSIKKNIWSIFVLLECLLFTLFPVGPKITARKPTLTPKSMLVRLEDKVPKLVDVLKGSRTRIRSASAGRDRKSGIDFLVFPLPLFLLLVINILYWFQILPPVTGDCCLKISEELLMKSITLVNLMSLLMNVKKQYWSWNLAQRISEIWLNGWGWNGTMNRHQHLSGQLRWLGKFGNHLHQRFLCILLLSKWWY